MLQSLFKIRIRLTCGSKFLELWTDAIKVVAKLDSIRKKQAEKEGVTVPVRKNNKRARSDELIESLSEIKEEQKLQRELIQSVLHSISQQPVLPSPCSSPLCSPSSISVETAFQQLLDAFERANPTERPNKIRRIMNEVPVEQRQVAAELAVTFSQNMEQDYRSNESFSSPQQEELSQSEESPSGVSQIITTDPLLLEDLKAETFDDLDVEPSTATDLEYFNEVLREYLTTEML